MLKTFKYRLYPSRHQIRLLEQTLETCRRWYNACLAERKEAWEKEHRSIGQSAQRAKIQEFGASIPSPPKSTVTFCKSRLQIWTRRFKPSSAA